MTGVRVAGPPGPGSIKCKFICITVIFGIPFSGTFPAHKITVGPVNEYANGSREARQITSLVGSILRTVAEFVARSCYSPNSKAADSNKYNEPNDEC